MAAAMKLNPAAALFPCPSPYTLHLAPPAPPPFPLADAACSPQFPFVTYCCVTAPPAAHIGFCFPAQPPSPPPAVCKGSVPAPAAHGRLPHKLMRAFSGRGGVGKRQAAAAVKQWQEPAPALVQAAPRKPRVARRKAERNEVEGKPKAKTKAPWPRKAAGPRAVRAGSPSPTCTNTKYTKRRVPWWTRLPEPKLGRTTTTVMLRTISNKLRSSDVIKLLDKHCRRANKAAGAVVSAYDVLYLPMGFRREGKFGYAFINFTTAAAARRFYFSMQWCGWNVHGSKKVIHIVPAKIQGKQALEMHFKRQKLDCANDEFLPAVFSPPRDGVTTGAGNPKRLGRLACWMAPTTPTPATPPKAS
ncbi:Protein MEI2-like 7 [Dichanthelium oligosanthes]|uniref:Protein MEI2-like 7 n=1 Tax=Dichanthelium oligosanthes TaxID=888268 RepID=A0A1E5WGN6_9POAL|nr:Protein MEI2-like 7 [Dichanthelium oligosanthes]